MSNGTSIPRRRILGYATAGLTGMAVTALADDGKSQEDIKTLQECSSDGKIISFKDCATAVIEGTAWDEILVDSEFLLDGGIDAATNGVSPNETGVTEINVREIHENDTAVITEIRLFKDSQEVIAWTRPTDSECYEKLETDEGGDGSEDQHHIVIFGGSPDNVIDYTFTVSGQISPSSSGEGAPIDDEYVTVDIGDGDTITDDGRTAHGSLAGGGDAYDFTGEIESSDWGGAEVYLDGDQLS